MPKYDSPPYDPLGISLYNPFFTGPPLSPTDRARPRSSDRHDIIRRIKNADRERHVDPPHTPPSHMSHHHDMDIGLEILRPRSALHRGDFREDAQSHQPLSTSPVVPWSHQPQLLPRPRAASQASLSASFSYQPPTSPLVHQANAADMPDHPTDHFTPTRQSHIHLHRHSSLRTFPYQAHQPRRSIGSIGSLSQSPFSSARRPSISDASPLQHAPMVGSYEESILRGRMSTTPSKPLDFVAQIGVLGKGDCKPSLKCPPHVAIPFPAVFYSYASGTRTDPEPSPYVGMVDLENSLKKHDDPECTAARRRRRHLHEQEHGRSNSRTRDDNAVDEEKARKRRQQKINRRTGSSTKSAPQGGSYRIPAQGQLQIVIKNPNKTAVKLFLVPYDLSDMEPGTKTFIRQRAYSAGPVVDMPLTSRRNYGTDRPEAAIGGVEDPKDRPVLRYLIHLHICCPSKGRYYLYQNIRVVFANRVPDGKEKLRTETQMPEPRYSAFKPCSTSSSDAMAAAEAAANAKRRRSAVFPSHNQQFDIYTHRSSGSMDSGSFAHNGFSLNRAFDSRLPTLESRPASRDDVDMDMQSSPEFERFSFERDAGFVFERERTVGEVPRAESLLSRKLRDLEMRGRQS